MSTQHILVVGNPVDGFTFTGPFDSVDDAMLAGEGSPDPWWAPKLEPAEPSEFIKLRNIKESLLLAIAHRFLREYDSEIHDGTMKELVAELRAVEEQMEEEE